MQTKIVLTDVALSDLFNINDYFLQTVSDKKASEIINSLENAVNSLAEFPERGSYPKELLTLGIRQYRQIIVKPYRIIYEVFPEKIIVHAVLDGRRDIQTLFTQRLLN
ncbi:MAG: type II toxin-antitoxin system mRNA interferase toxin, RelE/StbE family [Methylococcaceae bacterium]|nr:type II toxin-antitoxin system mRNA interferase toxin, RelE/StbE family [Methylococcaceae bacterium]